MADMQEEGVWCEAYDENQQRPYYYHSVTGDTSWEKPDSFVPLNEEHGEADDAGEDMEHEQEDRPEEEVDEGEEEMEEDNDTCEWKEAFDENKQLPYYYNIVTGDTTWERPAELDQLLNQPSQLAQSNDLSIPASSTVLSAMPMEEEDSKPALTPQQEAEEKLSKHDSIMEPDVFTTVEKFLEGKGREGPTLVAEKLYSNYVGYAAMCNLVSEWIVDFAPPYASNEGMSQKVKDGEAENVLVDSLSTMVKSKFDSEVADRSTVEYEEMPRWLKGMTRDEQGKELLMSLYAKNKDSMLLKRCMVPILKHETSSLSASSNASQVVVIATKEIYDVFDLNINENLKMFRSSPDKRAQLLTDISNISCNSEHCFLFTQQLLHRIEADQDEVSMSSFTPRHLMRLKHRRLRQELERLAVEDARSLKRKRSATTTAVTQEDVSKSAKLVYHLSFKHQDSTCASTLGDQVHSTILEVITLEKPILVELKQMHSFFLPMLPIAFEKAAFTIEDDNVKKNELFYVEDAEIVRVAEQARHPTFIKTLLRYIFIPEYRQTLDEVSCYYVACIVSFLSHYQRFSSSKLGFSVYSLKQEVLNVINCSVTICSNQKFSNVPENMISLETETEIYDGLQQSSLCSYGLLLHLIHSVESPTFLDRYHLTPLGCYLRLCQHVYVSWPLLRPICLSFLSCILTTSPSGGASHSGASSVSGGAFMINDHQKEAIVCMKQLVTLGFGLEVFEVFKTTVNSGLIDRRTMQDFIKGIDDIASPPFANEFLKSMGELAKSVGISSQSLRMFKS